MIAVRHPARRLLAATAILVALAAIVAGIGFLRKDDGPMKLVSVCTGEGTQTVSCTWIPVED